MGFDPLEPDNWYYATFLDVLSEYKVFYFLFLFSFPLPKVLRVVIKKEGVAEKSLTLLLGGCISDIVVWRIWRNVTTLVPRYRHRRAKDQSQEYYFLAFPLLSVSSTAFLSLSPITPFSPFNNRILSTRCGAQSTAVFGLCKSEAHGSAHS